MSVSQPEKNLECYLVGGAVRDELLGLEVSDKDWVVVGATPDQMLKLDFTPIGKDFPVFLHPETKEEYALARTERKSGVGYKGFKVYASPEVTLVEDLQRRDLTINAIAKSIDGRIIDPFYGRDDLRMRTLRHVSPAFSEDPVRILRTARFAARYAELGFKIQNDTLSLMRQMVDNNEVDALVAERVWQELSAALRTHSPSVFFITLRTCGALSKIFPEIDALFGVPQTAEYHPEIDTGVHTMMVIDRARELTDDIDALYAALTHDLGKSLTPKIYLPSHRGHEARGVPLVKNMSERIRAPKETTRLAEITSEQHLNMHRLEALLPGTILKLLVRLDAFRKPDRVKKFGIACQADAQGRGGDHASRNYPQREQIMEYFFAASHIDAGEIAKSQKDAKKIGAAIVAARVDAIRKLKQRHQSQIRN